MQKPNSNTTQILESNGFKFIGFHSLEEPPDHGIELREWEIHSKPFVSISHNLSGAMWIPFRCQYGFWEIRRLLWLGSARSWKQWRDRDELWSLQRKVGG